MSTVLERPRSVTRPRPVQPQPLASQPLVSRPIERAAPPAERRLTAGVLLSGYALVVSLLVLVLFGLDLATGVPFNRASQWMDVGFVVSGSLLAWLSWTTLREARRFG